MEAEQEIRDREETHKNYVEKNIDESNKMLELYEADKMKNNNEISSLKDEIAKQEEEARRARKFYNKRMSEVDCQLLETNRKVLEQKKRNQAMEKT